jgi:hypothetical protein
MNRAHFMPLAFVVLDLEVSPFLDALFGGTEIS